MHKTTAASATLVSVNSGSNFWGLSKDHLENAKIGNIPNHFCPVEKKLLQYRI